MQRTIELVDVPNRLIRLYILFLMLVVQLLTLAVANILQVFLADFVFRWILDLYGCILLAKNSLPIFCYIIAFDYIMPSMSKYYLKKAQRCSRFHFDEIRRELLNLAGKSRAT